MKNQFSILLVLFIFLSACGASETNKIGLAQPSQSQIPVREHTLQSVLWQQRSAEYRALCHQAFNMAKLQLDRLISEHADEKKPLAIITDIDETLLNNSPYNAKMIETDKNYSKEGWIQWGLLEQAISVPGALDFYTYAASKGVATFYISNRYVDQQKETKGNLEKLGYPFVDDRHVLLREKTSGKEERRQLVFQENTVLMFLGDNLSDFNDLFDDMPAQERNQSVEELKHKFGVEYIVLPNPMYGDWETKGLYEGNYSWSPKQKDSIRRAKLISY